MVVFDSNGSYPSTYIGQGSNFGFTGGLLGYDTDDPRLKDSVEIARETGIDISFSEEVLSACHPNEARIDIYGENDQVELSVLTFSTGGGMFEIAEMDGFPVHMDGSEPKIYICCQNNGVADLKQCLLKLPAKLEWKEKEGKVLFCISEYPDSCEEELLAFAGLDKVKYVRKAPVVLPVAMRKESIPLFSNAEEALRYAEEQNKTAWEMAIAYECSVGYIEPAEVMEKARHTLEVMKKASVPPCPEKTPQFGFLPYQCVLMEQNKPEVDTVDTGFLNRAAMYAIAVMENSCAHNTVVAAPTAGASGVIPAGILAIGEQMNCSEEELIQGLLAAGLTGAFIANHATFGGEVAACQAENGAASAMAAAGIVQLLGGSVRQGFQAASMALQNMLGLVCDPVGGLTEIPCISRNVSAVANAAMSANMVMLGFDPVIPLDETIACMLRVGRMIPRELRCTCEGGLCTTPTGCKIAKQLGRKAV